jgi:hypothetical protein
MAISLFVVNASSSRIDGPDVVLNAEAGQTLA